VNTTILAISPLARTASGRGVAMFRREVSAVAEKGRESAEAWQARMVRGRERAAQRYAGGGGDADADAVHRWEEKSDRK
jgi:hypothetical protein